MKKNEKRIQEFLRDNEKIEKKEEAPAPVETKTEEFDEEIPF